jgi:hypothetical protein
MKELIDLPLDSQQIDIHKYLTVCLQLLLRACGDTSTDLRLAADDTMKRLLKLLVDNFSDKILVL